MGFFTKKRLKNQPNWKKQNKKLYSLDHISLINLFCILNQRYNFSKYFLKKLFYLCFIFTSPFTIDIKVTFSYYAFIQFSPVGGKVLIIKNKPWAKSDQKLLVEITQYLAKIQTFEFLFIILFEQFIRTVHNCSSKH